MPNPSLLSQVSLEQLHSCVWACTVLAPFLSPPPGIHLNKPEIAMCDPQHPYIRVEIRPIPSTERAFEFERKVCVYIAGSVNNQDVELVVQCHDIEAEIKRRS